jgi:hypothetical protein
MQPSLSLAGIPFKRESHFIFTNKEKYLKKNQSDLISGKTYI